MGCRSVGSGRMQTKDAPPSQEPLTKDTPPSPELLTEDAPPSPELLGKIRNAITSDSPTVHRNKTDIPVAVFGNGAKVGIAMEDPMTLGGAVFVSDPSANLRFRGAADRTVYLEGRGAVVLEGKTVYLYHLTVPDEQLVSGPE